jgi:hypothetical protein
MLGKLKSLVKGKKQKQKKRVSHRSREVKTQTSEALISKSTVISREVAASSARMDNFEGFRHMLKDLSRRLDAIRENPEETYLINTEVNLRLLGVLENLANSTERNASAIEKLTGLSHLKQQTTHDLDKKRRAREVLAVLETSGAQTYEELRRELKPTISYNRVTALVSEMIRDGVPLRREGKPVKVSLQEA